MPPAPRRAVTLECPSRSPTWRAISLCIGSRHAEQADYRQVTRLVGSPLGTSQPERQLTPPAVAARVQLVRCPLGTPGDSNQRGGPAARRRIVRARRGAQDRRVDHRPVPAHAHQPGTLPTATRLDPPGCCGRPSVQNPSCCSTGNSWVGLRSEIPLGTGPTFAPFHYLP